MYFFVPRSVGDVMMLANFGLVVVMLSPPDAVRATLDSELAQLVESPDFSRHCIGPISSDIEVNIDPRYRARAAHLASALRGRLDADYLGIVFERTKRNARVYAPKNCRELEGSAATSAEVHVSLVQGAGDRFTKARMVVRTVDGSCKEIQLVADRSSYQCLEVVPLAVPRRRFVSEKDMTLAPSVAPPPGIDGKRMRSTEIDEGVILLSVTGFASLMVLGGRLSAIVSEDPVPGWTIGALTWNGAFALAGPTGHYMGRYFVRPNRRRTIGLAIGGGILLVSGLALKPIAWTKLDGSGQGFAFLYSDFASIAGIAMVGSAHGQRLALRAGVNGVSIGGRF